MDLLRFKFFVGGAVGGARCNWVLAVLELASLLGLLLPGTALAGVWVFGIGFILGGTFGLALLLIVLRTPDTEGATELSH